MIYRFDAFELDTGKVELRENGAAIPLEPQVFALLLLLLENRDRMVSKDEIVERIWGGRAISASALSSRIKTARRALGDDGNAQRYIRTIHGGGFRFAAPARALAPAEAPPAEPSASFAEAAPATDAGAAERRTIAVLPFRLLGDAGAYGAIADAIPHDLIIGLARLRWLFVIARGSTFRFRGGETDIRDVGKLLGARYCLTGAVDIFGGRIGVSVELADARDRAVIWADRLEAAVDAVHEIRTEIVTQTLAAIDIGLPLHEARAARMRDAERLDAWSAFHLGLKHMYRFNRVDNAAALALFERAAELEPGFARAQAGLSFTHFQNAFLRYSDDPDASARAARRAAERAIELDDRDPYANFTLGRAFWLEGDLDGSSAWLERATDLSPSFAQGFYARAWAATISGDAEPSGAHLDRAAALSPLDPFMYAMLSLRALAALARSDTADAARWGEKSACSPGAHALILAITIAAHELNGDAGRAALWARRLRERHGQIDQTHFFAALPFPDAPLRRRLSGALTRHGI